MHHINTASTALLSTNQPGNQTDHIALLAIKSQLVDRPNGVLTSWNNSVHHCNWNGVTCGQENNRVTILDLHSEGLAGTISPFIGNLSFLKSILLYNNNLRGQIPSELGNLVNLQNLYLFQNTLSGEIPANLSGCVNLRNLSIAFNKLEGKLPVELRTLSKLEVFGIENNNCTGPLFDIIANLTSIRAISTGYNAFTGTIPNSIGRFQNLSILRLYNNEFSGTLPKSLFHLPSLQEINLPSNQFTGELPDDIGFTLPRLTWLLLSGNKFSGSIPTTLVNLTDIESIDLGDNNFTGKVPKGFEKLHNLTYLTLSFNYLTEDIKFISTLVNCTKLQLIDLRGGGFTGKLPASIGNLSIGLQKLGLGRNDISGTIPAGIINLINLTILDMSYCMFTGALPRDIGKLRNLEQILFNSNRLTSRIPESLGSIPRMTNLYLDDNIFEGSIPPSLGNCRSLLALNLSYNKLNGTLNSELLNGFAKFVQLDLSHNYLEGSIPSEISQQTSLGYLRVSKNKFSGVIPDGFGQCVTLQQLYMDGNSFHGAIPSSFASLSSLEEIDLSDNDFSGSIPNFFSKFSSLHYLNISYNDFEGRVPTNTVFANKSAIYLAGNKKLCGGISDLHLPKCTEKKIKETSNRRKKTQIMKVIIPTVCTVFGVLVMTIGLYLAYIKSKKKQVSSGLEMGKSFLKVSYDMLLKATDGFSSDKLLGAGTFGSVFEGIMDGKTVAVKVLNLQQRGASKSFIAECKALRNIRHRNLVGIITACSSTDFQRNDFKALVYEFMPNGSLDRWLNGAGNMNILQRVDIAIDMAHALNYLHHDCETPIVHCDLKPSNILLDHDMIAHVGDFGLAKILTQPLHPNQSSTIGVRGTVGYVAPEYGLGSEPSTDGDVYSYGILLLELMTGKRPTDNMFKEGFNLHMYAKAALPDQVMQIVDPSLQDNENTEEVEHRREIQDSYHQKRECIFALVSVGVACSDHSPEDRMKIPDVISRLQAAKYNLLNPTRTRH
ncbi:uncharacterized protein LOC141618670 [Silene latifolia]|uniref:uncharacterized protein LOC141618670 n=1 Tax=Silene latifolia TaxID=37657 RepID=UPI003D76B76A